MFIYNRGLPIKAYLKICLILLLSIGQAWTQDKIEKLDSKVDDYNVEQILRPLSLGGAIQQGLQQNHNQINRGHQKEVLEIGWKDTWSAFWLPDIDLNLSITPHRLAQFRQSDGMVGSIDRNTGGSLSLNLGQYTLFNWGKDYLQFLNDKQNYKRNLQVLTEGERELKFSIIEAFGDLVSSKDRLKTYKKILRHSSYAYRIAKEKVAAKKLSLQTYYQIRTLYLESYEQYIQEKREFQTFNETLAFLIDDEINTRYSLKNSLQFHRVTTPLDELIKILEKNNPEILQSYTNEKVSERNLEVARRNNLALPTISIELGAFSRNTTTLTQSQGYNGGTSGNENLEVVATLNASWPILGTGGFLGRRTLSAASLNYQIASRTLKRSVDLHKYNLTNAFQRLKTYEDQYEITLTKKQSAKTAYEITLEKYNKGKTTFLNYLHTLTDLSEAEVAMTNLLNNHLKEKVNIARFTGIPDLPSNLFEHSTKSVKEINEYEQFRNNQNDDSSETKVIESKSKEDQQ